MYEKILQKASEGIPVTVNFKERTLSVNHKKVELDGAELGIEKFDSLDDWLDKAEDLYDAYKYSRPSEVADKKQRHGKFKALSVNELIRECGHNALSNPQGRNEALAALEVFILFSLINGSFKPEELFAKDWFYQGADDWFILRKDWF